MEDRLMTSRIMPSHGGYKALRSYKNATVIYDATVYFVGRFYKIGDRTIDQMVQAARSGKQNIVEASLASATSKESEIKLTNVARASLGELLIDFEDFLRLRHLQEWPKTHPYSLRLKELLQTMPSTYATFRKGIEHSDPSISANVIMYLIKVTSYLLSRQLSALERDFLQNGGLRERMAKARLASKKATASMSSQSSTSSKSSRP